MANTLAVGLWKLETWMKRVCIFLNLYLNFVFEHPIPLKYLIWHLRSSQMNKLGNIMFTSNIRVCFFFLHKTVLYCILHFLKLHFAEFLGCCLTIFFILSIGVMCRTNFFVDLNLTFVQSIFGDSKAAIRHLTSTSRSSGMNRTSRIFANEGTFFSEAGSTRPFLHSVFGRTSSSDLEATFTSFEVTR